MHIAVIESLVVREDFEHLFGITYVFLDTEIGDLQIKVQRRSHADW